MIKSEFCAVFDAYTSKYDLTDAKILLKYIHTGRVVF